MEPSFAFRYGDSGPAVIEIRSKLDTLGLLSPRSADNTLDAKFDDICDRAVRAFQQQRGLNVDGVVGPQTYRFLEEARWRLGDRILRYSISGVMVGDDARALQQRLAELGFDPGRVDGIFGPKTEQALRDFQRNLDLSADGSCGPATLKAIKALGRLVVGGQPQAMRESEIIHRAGPALSGKVVIVDAGYSGTQSRRGIDDLAVRAVIGDLASRVEGRLGAAGVQAFLSHSINSPTDELTRANFANATEANLVISLDVDEHDNPLASGVATYHYGGDRDGGHSAVGEKFAGLLQREILARTDLHNCRTHGKTWDLLRHTRMPAVKVDVGYITNVGDAARLADPSFRDVLAEAIVVAVQRLYLPPDLDSPTGVLQLAELLAT
jgi:N-acetylmuramoyl-L-alanine amidase